MYFSGDETLAIKFLLSKNRLLQNSDEICGLLKKNVQTLAHAIITQLLIKDLYCHRDTFLIKQIALCYFFPCKKDIV